MDHKTAFLSVLSALLLAFSSSSVGANSAKEYKSQLIQFYKPFGFHPFLLPEGQTVGDVIDYRTLAILHRSEECFPGLVSGENEADIPSILLLKNAAAGFWATIKKFFNVRLETEETRRTYIWVEDATIRSTSLGALQKALASDCEEMLRPIFEQNIKATVGNRPADVVMSVMRGRLHTILSYETDANAEAEMEDMSAILREISRNLEAGAEAAEGLSAELAVRFGLSERLNVVLKSDEPSTLAFRPATIISSNLGLRAMFPSLAGSEDAGSEGNELPTEPFDLEEPAHIERLGLRMDAWALGKV